MDTLNLSMMKKTAADLNPKWKGEKKLGSTRCLLGSSQGRMLKLYSD